ncbi:MAG: twin-arginine translocase TatA/TatE family subunit [Pseudomonadota bacterium]|jgi:sec-independent protein translocase protein TatA|nr:twin-arginine translocase TatA/TatE family subunit [Pseudomonadota bacterium]
MSPSIWQLLIVAVVALLLFGGRGRISSIMGDLAKGITSFRKGLKEEEAETKAVDGDDMVNITPEKEKAESKD